MDKFEGPFEEGSRWAPSVGERPRRHALQRRADRRGRPRSPRPPARPGAGPRPRSPPPRRGPSDARDALQRAAAHHPEGTCNSRPSESWPSRRGELVFDENVLGRRRATPERCEATPVGPGLRTDVLHDAPSALYGGARSRGAPGLRTRPVLEEAGAARTRVNSFGSFCAGALSSLYEVVSRREGPYRRGVEIGG